MVLLLAACASRAPAPIEDRRGTGATPLPPTVAAPEGPAAPVEVPVPTYTVKKGDTFYKIALDHGLDYRDLAAWNNVTDINLIRVGQVLRLAPPGATGVADTGTTTTPLRTTPPVQAGAPGAVPGPQAAAGPRNPDNYKSAPKAVKEPYSEQAVRDVTRLASASLNPSPGAPPAVAAEPAPAPAPPPTPTIVGRAGSDAAAPAPGTDDEDGRLNWMWPAEGKVVTGFSDTANLKGIDIAGKSGQPVFATAAGRVVYAGTGLRGYGKLIIVKHNTTYLSAYAHNKDILVKEGQQVARGQKIAEMGNTDSEHVMLHFEIRKMGKPMDPLKFLPPA